MVSSVNVYGTTDKPAVITTNIASDHRIFCATGRKVEKYFLRTPARTLCVRAYTCPSFVVVVVVSYSPKWPGAGTCGAPLYILRTSSCNIKLYSISMPCLCYFIWIWKLLYIARITAAANFSLFPVLCVYKAVCATYWLRARRGWRKMCHGKGARSACTVHSRTRIREEDEQKRIRFACTQEKHLRFFPHFPFFLFFTSFLCYVMNVEV